MSESHDKSSLARGALLRALADNARNARHERGLTQAEVAERMGVSAAYIGIIERARRNVPYLTVVSLARALGVPPARLFETAGPAVPDAATWPPAGAARVAPTTSARALPETRPPIALRRWRPPSRRR